MQREFLKYKIFCFYFLLLAFAICGDLRVAQGQVLPLEHSNTLTGEWMVYDTKAEELVPYVSVLHTKQTSLHQWLTVSPMQPFRIGFAAPKDLCLFLNNRLIFKADSTATYKLNLSDYTSSVKPVDGKVLLTVWHPSQQPNTKSFYNDVQVVSKTKTESRAPFLARVRDQVNQNAFILFLLLLGLIYGWLKVNYPSEFSMLFNFRVSGRSNRLDEGVMANPISSWSNILFILAFSLSLALLIAAIHTNVEHIRLFNRLFPVSEADITTKIGVYTLVIFVFILLKYLFLRIMSYIFGLENVVVVQYREFIKTLLSLGIFLPLVMLLYLSVNNFIPEVILLMSNVLVSMLLLLVALRVFIVVNKKATVLNLHLFSYLCATEVIPLAIVLKLIVFSF